jgi:hypothetical protein
MRDGRNVGFLAKCVAAHHFVGAQTACDLGGSGLEPRPGTAVPFAPSCFVSRSCTVQRLYRPLRGALRYISSLKPMACRFRCQAASFTGDTSVEPLFWCRLLQSQPHGGVEARLHRYRSWSLTLRPTVAVDRSVDTPQLVCTVDTTDVRDRPCPGHCSSRAFIPS